MIQRIMTFFENEQKEEELQRVNQLKPEEAVDTDVTSLTGTLHNILM